MAVRFRPTLVKTKNIAVKLPDFTKMKKAELEQYAKDKGIELDSGLTKVEIIEKINEMVGVE